MAMILIFLLFRTLHGLRFFSRVDASNDLVIANFLEDSSGTEFDLIWKGTKVKHVSWQLPGLFNARNLAMALLSSSLVQSLNRDQGEVLHNPFSGIAEIEYGNCLGVKRRQEILFKSEDLTVLSDFAHHPTAIKGALESLRLRWPDRKIVACFEPRSNTAVTNIFQDRFAEALSLADHSLIGEVHRAERIDKNSRINPDEMVQLIKTQGKSASAFSTNVELGEF